MEVIILAGGKGTRLKSVIDNVPKPMAPINGLPFLAYQLEWLSCYRVSKIVLSVGYMANVIKDFFKESFNGITIEYAEELQPLGTGGAIRNALQLTDSDHVMVVNGDTWFPIDINVFSDFHQSQGGSLSIALKKMYHFDRYGSVELNHSTISGFIEKQPQDVGIINGGIYLINSALLNIDIPRESFSFETDVMEPLAATGTLKGKVFEEDFIDIGIPSDYLLAERSLPRL